MKTTVTDPGNDTTSYTYDFLGRPTQITLPDSSSVSYTYDDTNNKVTFTNGRSYERIFWYDWLSRLEKVEEEYATDTFTSTTYTYDEIGHLLSFYDPENHTTSYTYASAFGLTRTTYPDSEYETYTYDNMGNIASFTDCKGNTTSYAYDDLYRLTEIEYQDQSTVSYTYDLNSNRIRMDDDAPGTGDYVAYTYDQWNRLVTETRYISQDSYAVSYQYDTANRVTKMTYPDSMQIVYTYDDLNRITEIKRYVDGQNDEILFDDPQYDVENLLTQFDYGNGIRATYTYDSRDRPSTIDMKDGVTSLLDLDYTYDNNNNITQLANGWRDTSSTWHSETESYSYDGLDRLTSGSCTSWSHTYSYDRAGNRTGKDSLTYTVNSVNEVTALSDGTTFSYDDNGNRTQKTKGTDTWDYTYDYANRLIKVEENDSVIGEYVFGGGGNRLQKTENSITTTYIYSGINTLYEENSTGSAGYVYGPTGLLAKRTTINQETHIYFYHTDHLGSVRSVTDSSKNIIAASTYHPFGEIEVEEGSEKYLYNGKERDSTGLYYYGARYYEPQIGKFITRDLIKGRKSNSQSLNRYAYCLNNPIKFVDPLGLSVTSFHNSKTGITIENTANGWIAYDANGNKIGSQAGIERAIEEGRYIDALEMVLKVLGYGDNIYQKLDDRIMLLFTPSETAMDHNIFVTIKFSPMDSGITKDFEMSYLAKTEDGGKKGTNITITIYKDAFFDNGKPCANKLLHVVGHEMVHAYNRMHNYYDWDEEWRDAWDETLAYSFTLVYWYIFPWGGRSDLKRYQDEYLENILLYMKESGVGVP